MFPGLDHEVPDPEVAVHSARVRIRQAGQLLQQLGRPSSVDDPGRSPEVCLGAADMLWRRLLDDREQYPQIWEEIEVDGLQAEHVLNRLNDVVYDLLCATVA